MVGGGCTLRLYGVPFVVPLWLQAFSRLSVCLVRAGGSHAQREAASVSVRGGSPQP